MTPTPAKQPYSPTGLTVAVIGTGYVGLTMGAYFAKLGHNVICADIIPARVEMLKRGEIPILEDGLQELVQEGIANGNLSFVLGATFAVTECDFAFMCLPTPQGADGAADLSYLLSAAREIAPMLPSGAIVVNKSTVPVGSAQIVSETIGRDDIHVASNPEFLREGTALVDSFSPDRIVIGASSNEVAERVSKLYASVGAPKLLVDTATAELIKYASNAFLASKISFANSIAGLCEAVGANAHDVLEGMGYDNRIGKQFLKPGPGWGGSCFPKDVHALINIAEESGYQFDLLRAVIRANEVQQAGVVQKVKQLLGGDVKGKTIAAWGLAFKSGTDDVRQSPAVQIIEKLVRQGARVQAYDPGVTKPIDGITMAADALSACDGADFLIVLTEWQEFGEVPLKEVAKRLSSLKLLDTRNMINLDQLAKHGFEYSSVGHGAAVTKQTA